MVTILAKNAVAIKCTFENAVMTGNYECAYGLGVLNGFTNKPKVTDYNSIIDLKEHVLILTDGMDINDKKICRLLKIIKDYEPSDVFDSQMEELFDLGYNDKKI